MHLLASESGPINVEFGSFETTALWLTFAISLLAAVEDRIPPTINQFTPDPECDLDCAPNRMVERKVGIALSNSFGFGGHNVTLAVSRFQP